MISDEAKERIDKVHRAGRGERRKSGLDGRSRVEGYEKGSFVGPTIFEGVSPDMTIAKEEIFGPVLSVIHVDTLEEAIKLIEDSPYGNAASIFTKNGKAARKFRYRVSAGNIGINIGVAAPIASFPFPGEGVVLRHTARSGPGRGRLLHREEDLIQRWL